jgi:hypothetical protein
VLDYELGITKCSKSSTLKRLMKNNIQRKGKELNPSLDALGYF